jgi:hypothetical protein
MKLFGVSLGSLLLARCQRTATSTPPVTCYTIAPPTHTPTSIPISTPPPVTCYAVIPLTGTPPASGEISARNRLRVCWLRFDELAEKTSDGSNNGGDGDDPLGEQMIAEHRAALDEMAAIGTVSAPVADLIQEAYAAAVRHVWRSNAPILCYDMAFPDYAPASAENLVRQAETLEEVSGGGTVAPETVEKIRTALEHDLAFYALTDADIQALYDTLAAEYGEPGELPPAFEEIELALTSDVKTAAQFLLDLLMGDK